MASDGTVARRPRRTHWLVVWWVGKAPHAALFQDEVAAEAAANVRNALVVKLSGVDIEFEAVLDWWRRDDAGKPMPAEWRDLAGPIRSGWRGPMPHLAR